MVHLVRSVADQRMNFEEGATSWGAPALPTSRLAEYYVFMQMDG